ncbi:MAG TPA: hypothetical protein VFV38_30740 [Ktedonobacteraceae bacterium]|nr:hypothetical protein [Ktedonobacteraceae bacterium]
MRIIEVYYDQIDWGLFPHRFANWANEASLKADKNRTPEQREQFKQQVVQDLETAASENVP